MHAERCTCRECRLLDAMPAEMQGIPDTFQFALFGKPRQPLITPTIFAELVGHIRDAGYGDDIDWAESCRPPRSAEEFSREAIFVICNSGMRFTVAKQIFDRVMRAIEAGKSAHTAFNHSGKAQAMGSIYVLDPQLV